MTFSKSVSGFLMMESTFSMNGASGIPRGLVFLVLKMLVCVPQVLNSNLTLLTLKIQPLFSTSKSISRLKDFNK